MTLQNLLETFDAGAKVSSLSDDTALAIERSRAAGFEEGYASGWEDANKADKDTQKRIAAEFERNIQGIAFTYAEAVDRVRGELEEFVTALIGEFLAKISPMSFVEHVRVELMSIGDDLIDVPIEIVTSSNTEELMDQLLSTMSDVEASLIVDKNLSDSQAFVRLGTKEIEINFQPLCVAIERQFDAIKIYDKKEVSNG